MPNRLTSIFRPFNSVMVAALVLPIVATIIAVVAYLTLAGGRAHVSQYHPLRFDPPVEGSLKVTDRVEGDDGPVTRLGEPVHLAATGSHLCNDANHDVSISITYSIFGVDAQGRSKSVDALTQPIVVQIPPGCSMSSGGGSGVSLPAEIGVGKWAISINISASENGQTQQIGFLTEQFRTVQ